VAKLGLDTTKLTIVVGSTRGEDEEKFVLDALGSIGFERFNVVHAPRHLERVAALSDLVKQRTGSVALRSKGESGPYLILDTYGELSAVYSVADLVIVGGGFANLGGQNIIQPLALGKPVLHGIHMQNFRDVSAIADNAGAATACATPQDLATSVRRLLQDAIVRFEMGSEARQLVWNNVGASRRYAEAIAAEVPNAR
jgi:3-deoxy-D-manno-octulosonic-acid transferase